MQNELANSERARLEAEEEVQKARQAAEEAQRVRQAAEEEIQRARQAAEEEAKRAKAAAEENGRNARRIQAMDQELQRLRALNPNVATNDLDSIR